MPSSGPCTWPITYPFFPGQSPFLGHWHLGLFFLSSSGPCTWAITFLIARPESFLCTLACSSCLVQDPVPGQQPFFIFRPKSFLRTLACSSCLIQGPVPGQQPFFIARPEYKDICLPNCQARTLSL